MLLTEIAIDNDTTLHKNTITKNIGAVWSSDLSSDLSNDLNII